MSKKKIEVVELNKKEDKILLAEKQSALILFWRRHSILLYLALLLLSLMIIGVSLMAVMKNMDKIVEPTIKNATVDISLSNYDIALFGDSLTDESAVNAFLNNGKFSGNGEVLLVKKVEHSQFVINYYSDGTALKVMKNSKNSTRIGRLDNGDYGIKEDGTISSNAVVSDVTLTNSKNYSWGTVNYFSDGSAEIINSKFDIFVRNSNDINDNYISNNKVSYIKESKNVGNVKLNYYYDGSIEVIKNNNSYLVRDINDLLINNGVSFKNNNESVIYKSLKMDDGVIIDYYDDGGAIIKKGTKTLSVRKSNSIIIKNNKIFEIVDNIYVDETKKVGNTTYYSNGGAVIDKHNGKTLYLEENSNIKRNDNNEITNIGNDAEELSNETNINGENVKVFDKTAVIKTNDYIAILPKDKVMYDTDGKIKKFEEPTFKENNKGFSITNNSNQVIKYRVVLEESNKTSLNVDYLRFQASAKNKYVKPTKIKDAIWKEDNIFRELGVTGTNYILIENSLEPFDSADINIMLWTDYDTIPNSEQDKYFYGTIRVYAWTEE